MREPAPRIFDDPFAIDLLSPRMRRLVTNPVLRGLQRLLLGALAPMLEEQVCSRSRFAEDALEQAMVAGLENELDTLTGWLTLLTAPGDLPRSWGLPEVAGVILEGLPVAANQSWSLPPPGRRGARFMRLRSISSSSRNACSRCWKLRSRQPKPRR